MIFLNSVKIYIIIIVTDKILLQMARISFYGSGDNWRLITLLAVLIALKIINHAIFLTRSNIVLLSKIYKSYAAVLKITISVRLSVFNNISSALLYKKSFMQLFIDVKWPEIIMECWHKTKIVICHYSITDLDAM